MSWSEMLDHVQEQSAEPQGAAIERLMAIESAAKTVIRLMHDWRTPNILGAKMRDALANLEVAYKMKNDGQETRKLDEAKTDYCLHRVVCPYSRDCVPLITNGTLVLPEILDCGQPSYAYREGPTTKGEEKP